MKKTYLAPEAELMVVHDVIVTSDQHVEDDDDI